MALEPRPQTAQCSGLVFARALQEAMRRPGSFPGQKVPGSALGLDTVGLTAQPEDEPWSLEASGGAGNDFLPYPSYLASAHPTVASLAETHCVLAAGEAAHCQPQTAEQRIHTRFLTRPWDLPLEGDYVGSFQKST